MEKIFLIGRFKESFRIKVLIKTIESNLSKDEKNRFNMFLEEISFKIRLMDNVFLSKEFQEILGDFHVEFVNHYNQKLEEGLIGNIFLEYGTKTPNFDELFEKSYIEMMRNYTFNLWENIPNKKYDEALKPIFGDFYNQVISKYPEIFEKKLGDIKHLYRSRAWDVFGGYEKMIPLEEYVRNNRWNPDGVAYLYLTCCDKIKKYNGKINIAEKTSFEEIRFEKYVNELDCFGRKKDKVAVCKFKALKKDARLLDLSYENVDVINKLQNMNAIPRELINRGYRDVINDEEIVKRANDLIKIEKKNKGEFIESMGTEIMEALKSQGNLEEIESLVVNRLGKVHLGHFCDSIFHSVDKEEDPDLKAYLPFRYFSKYLISKGYDGIIYRSTRMSKIGLKGTNIVLFNKAYATYSEGTMKVYKYKNGKYNVIKKY